MQPHRRQPTRFPHPWDSPGTSGSPWHQEPPSVHPGHEWGRSQELPSASLAGFTVRCMASCPGVLRVCLSPAGALLACPSFLYTHPPFLSQATCLGSLLGPWQIPCRCSGSAEMKRAPSLTSGCSMERLQSKSRSLPGFGSEPSHFLPLASPGSSLSH